MKLHLLSLSFLVFSCGPFGNVSLASELWIGTGTVSITPDKPVALAGQTVTRIAREVSGPCMATAVAIESRQDNKTLDYAILVSCDLIGIRGFEGRLRERVAKRLPDLDVKKVLLNATHTHTAPVLQEGKYDIPPDAMRATEYIEFLVDRVCDLVVKTWQSRRPGGGVSWGLGHAVVGNHRRMVYADGSAVMYGKTNIDTFRRVEGREDHGVEVLFFWDKNKRLLAVAVNVACPSQEVGMGKAVSADFWHEVRLGLRKKYGKNVQVLAWTGASGDQSPKLLWRTEAEERMRKGRGLTRLEEIARRIVHAVDEAHEVAKKDIRFTNVPLAHVVKEIDLPPRMLTDKEYAKMKAEYEKLVKANSTNRA
ncbi:MAG: hypothetical protein GX621_16075, partial [Pirellulaceae bacterium]|nr:hypothetical protein [Pirellulaceae bacterium]